MDQEVTGLGLLGNLELPQFFPPHCQGTGLAQAHGGFVPFPYSHPCSEGPANPNLSTWTVQIPASTMWVFPTPGVLQIPSATILERLCPSMRARPGPCWHCQVTTVPLGEIHWRCSHSLLLPSVNSGPRRVKMNQSRATGGWQGELHEAIPEITSVCGAGLCRNLPAPGVVFLGETPASPGSAEMKATLSWPLCSAPRRLWAGGLPGPPRCRCGGGDEFPGMSFQLSSAAGIGAAAIIGVTARGCPATPGPRPPVHGASAALPGLLGAPELCGSPRPRRGDRHSPRTRRPQGCCCPR